ncbi:MAG: phosphoribosyltransferase family protein [Candidatus Korobacteraceae bacterium]
MKSCQGTLLVICARPSNVHILACHGATGPKISQPALRQPAAPATRVQSCATLRESGWRVVFSSGETLERKRREQRAEQRAVLVAPVQALLRNVFSVLFPSDCRLCRTPLNNISRIPVCSECLEAMQPVRAPQCVICGDRLASAQLLVGDGRCHGCRDFEPEFARAMSFGEYESGLRGLIHLLKYESVLPVASVLGGMLASVIKELLPACGDSPALVVPVPLHKSKHSDRGFNQAELVARAAVRRLPKQVELANEVLVRQRATISQVGLTREQRIENMRDAFRVRDRPKVRGRIVILVDDVMTTGTTLSECARVLKKAGAERVLAATVARAFQGKPLQDNMLHVEQTPAVHAEEEASEAVAAAV